MKLKTFGTFKSVNEGKSPNSEAKTFLKGMQKVKIKGLGGWMPGTDYVYRDKKSNKWWFVDSEGDQSELKNKGTLAELNKFLQKNDISIKESQLTPKPNNGIESKGFVAGKEAAKSAWKTIGWGKIDGNEIEMADIMTNDEKKYFEFFNAFVNGVKDEMYQTAADLFSNAGSAPDEIK